MPGSPDPVLGSEPLTVGVALLVAAVVTAVPFVRRLPGDPVRIAVGGLAYALALVGVWAGARLLTGSFTSAFVEDPLSGLPYLLLALVVLTVQVVIPYYLHARWDLVAPLAGTFLATALVVYMFLLVRGESDPIGLYPMFFGPIVIVLIGVLALAEGGVRWTTSAA